MNKIPQPLEITSMLASNLIRNQFPEFAHLPITSVTQQGHDNRTYRLGEELLIRLPTAEPYALKVPIEQKLLPLLEPHLATPIPAPLKMGQIKKVVKLLPKKLGKTMTFDQGSEFADFKQFEQETKCLTYYCEPRSPWQRGTNENTNGRIRQYLPRNTSKEAITQEYLDNLSKKLNNTPRKCLGYLTPKEALLKDCRSFCRTSI